MDASNCSLPFPADVLRKCLDDKAYNLWEDIVQEDEIAAANLAGLERCPRCKFAGIFEEDFKQAPLLRCPRMDCGFVSCRKCKQKVKLLLSVAASHLMEHRYRITLVNSVMQRANAK